MITDYAKDPNLFPRCIEFINTVFPGCKDFAEKGEKYRASWREGSTPFIIEKEGEIIAHAGIWPLTFMLNAKEHHCAFIHGVCVKPEQRGKGYFKALMKEAMEYATTHYDSFALFTIKPYLYQNYPLKIMLPEYDFVLDESVKFSRNETDLCLLNLDNEQDLNLIHDLFLHRVPLSQQCSVLGQNGLSLFILNSLQRKIYYTDKLKTLLVFEIRNETLYLSEIISAKQPDLIELIEIIPGDYRKVILQFCPNNFLEEKQYSAILAGPECCFMASDTFEFKGKCFRYPELYWC